MVLREEVTGRRHAPQQQRGPVEEKEEAAPSEDLGWQEVGRRNRTVITRTVGSSSYRLKPYLFVHRFKAPKRLYQKCLVESLERRSESPQRRIR